MAVGSSFDRWQKDVFFSAAEEVQESADIMESMYRMWLRDTAGGFRSEVSDELRRELHTALGTARWQLEEFERAVKLSHETNLSEENTITRHNEFIAAIENQISRVDKALSDSLVEEGKQPFCWVQLDKEERDDLALFLSAVPRISQEIKDKDADHDRDSSPLGIASHSGQNFKETVSINKDLRYVVEVAAKEPSPSKGEVCTQELQLNGQGQLSSSSDLGSWKIVIADEEGADRKAAEVRQEMSKRASNISGLIGSVGSLAKLKWFRNSFWKAKSEEHLGLRRGLLNYLDLRRISRFTQGFNGLAERSKSCFSSCKEESKVSSVQLLAGKVGGFQRHSLGSQNYMQWGRSLRITFLVVLSIVLIAPFLLYST